MFGRKKPRARIAKLAENLDRAREAAKLLRKECDELRKERDELRKERDMWRYKEQKAHRDQQRVLRETYHGNDVDKAVATIKKWRNAQKDLDRISRIIVEPGSPLDLADQLMKQTGKGIRRDL
jgi:hypothetical protein